MEKKVDKVIKDENREIIEVVMIVGGHTKKYRKIDGKITEVEIEKSFVIPPDIKKKVEQQVWAIFHSVSKKVVKSKMNSYQVILKGRTEEFDINVGAPICATSPEEAIESVKEYAKRMKLPIESRKLIAVQL
ncbi:MAG: hypothetical protein PHE59_03080 [Patescibacteria group bacterium]|nr:hypothetical protein [Patescibacteria group bacterium]MDD5164625.1 hypothetical protein [Patescibacteria group bacterium]MDD5534533.1 hypothetical protein [Patescibacteria group bacterium]